MSIVFSGCRTRSKGLISSIAKQIKLINFKPLTKITVQFDPFAKEASATRDFLFCLSGKKISRTNLSCFIKTEIVCDRSEPKIICDFENQKKLILISSHLTTLELLHLFNKHINLQINHSEESHGPVIKK